MSFKFLLIYTLPAISFFSFPFFCGRTQATGLILKQDFVDYILMVLKRSLPENELTQRKVELRDGECLPPSILWTPRSSYALKLSLRLLVM
jgi:hypothetical protein